MMGRRLPVDILSVTNLGHDDVIAAVVDVVDYPILAGTNPPQLGIAVQLLTVGRGRVFLECLYLIKDLCLQVLG